MADILNEAVQSLKPAYRTVFVLRDIEEMSIEETAGSIRPLDLGCKKPVTSSASSAREKLTRQFDERGMTLLGYL